MTLCKSRGVGQYAVSRPSDGHSAVFERLWKFTQLSRGALYCPGYSSFDYSFLIPPNDEAPLRLVAHGVPVMSTNYGGGSTWGNDTGSARVDDAWAFMQSRYGVKTDKVLLMGGSMGGLTCLNWAKANPTKVAAMALIVPACDLADLRDNRQLVTPGDLVAPIETAYGGHAGYVSAEPSHNPAKNTSSFLNQGYPIHVWHSDNDPIIVPSVVVPFAQAIGATIHSQGAVGHTGEGVDADVFADFLGAYA